MAGTDSVHCLNKYFETKQKKNILKYSCQIFLMNQFTCQKKSGLKLDSLRPTWQKSARILSTGRIQYKLARNVY